MPTRQKYGVKCPEGAFDMSSGTLFDKVWDMHAVQTLPSGQTQLFIGLHLIHEVTSPQAFAMLREKNPAGGLPPTHRRHR